MLHFEVFHGNKGFCFKSVRLSCICLPCQSVFRVMQCRVSAASPSNVAQASTDTFQEALWELLRTTSLLYCSHLSCGSITHQWELIFFLSLFKIRKPTRNKKENTYAIISEVSSEDRRPYARPWLWVHKAMNICLKNYSKVHWAQGLCIFY